MAKKKKLYKVFLKRYTLDENHPTDPCMPVDREEEFIGETYAVSKEQAINNIKFRHKIKTGLIIDGVSWGVFQGLYAVEV